MKYLAIALGVLVGSLAALPTTAKAEENVMLICAAVEIQECDPGQGCRATTPDQVGIPRFFHIDFGENMITRTRGGEDVASPIERSEVVDGRIVLQGAEDGDEQLRDGVGWSISIDQETGSFVGTASGDGVAFVIFGDCTLN